MIPHVDGTIGERGLVAVGHDDVIVLAVAAEVGLGVGGFRAFLALVEAPVLAVEIEMVEPAAGVRPAHGPLDVPAEHFAQERVLGAGVARIEAPGVVLRGAQVEVVELCDALVVEERILQLRDAVVGSEEQPERVLRIAAAAAESSSNAQPRVDLKPFRPIGTQQLHRNGTLPCTSFAARVDVDAALRVEQVRQIGHQRNRGNRQQRIVHQVLVLRIVDHVRVHAIVDHLAVHVARRPGCRRALVIGRLRDDVVDEEIGVRLDGRSQPSGPHRRRSQTRGPADSDGLVIPDRRGADRSVFAAERIAPVRGVVDLGLFGGTRDAHVGRHVVEPARAAKPRFGDRAIVAATVRLAGRRVGHRQPVARSIGEPAIRDIDGLPFEPDGIQKSCAVGVVERNLFARGTEGKGGMKAGIRDIVVGPDQQIPLCRDRRAVGNPPARRIARIIRQVHTADAHRDRRRIVQLDPIVVLALRVCGPLSV